MSATQQEQLVKLSQEFQATQTELSNLIESRQRLEAQHNENTSVSKEFKQLSPNDKVYKLVGPALLLQEQAEARTNVEKRLEFISADLKKTEDLIKAAEAKLDAKKNEIVKIQTAAAAQRQAQAGQQTMVG